MPTIAAIRANVEDILGTPLTRDQARELRNGTNTVVLKHDLHATGRMYWRKNSATQIAEDQTDLMAVASKDQAVHLQNPEEFGYNRADLQKAFDLLNRRNKALFERLSTKEGVEQSLMN
jgi:hypothetical protein